MSEHELRLVDTFDTPDYLKEDFDDDELDIPQLFMPPNPDDTDSLPSQIHPSYPFGNPTSLKHPASRPRLPRDPLSRAFVQDLTNGGGVNGALRWNDLALDELLPIDEVKAEAVRAQIARKMASGSGNAGTQPPQGMATQQNTTAEGEDEEEEDEDDDEEEEEEGDEEGAEDEEDEDEDDMFDMEMEEQLARFPGSILPPNRMSSGSES